MERGCHAAEHPHRASLLEHAAQQRMAHAPSRVGLTGQSDAAKGNTILIIIRHGANTTKRGAKHTRDGVPDASLTTHAHKYARAHDDRTRFPPLSLSEIHESPLLRRSLSPSSYTEPSSSFLLLVVTRTEPTCTQSRSWNPAVSWLWWSRVSSRRAAA